MYFFTIIVQALWELMGWRLERRIHPVMGLLAELNKNINHNRPAVVIIITMVWWATKGAFYHRIFNTGNTKYM